MTPPSQSARFLAAAGRNAGRLRYRLGLAHVRPSGYWSIMAPALRPPFPPMEALSVDDIPTGRSGSTNRNGYFRCLVFRDGNKIELHEIGPVPDTPFPNDAAAAALRPDIHPRWGNRCSADRAFRSTPCCNGSIQQPRRSSRETPALIVFDPGGAEGKPPIERPLRQRRRNSSLHIPVGGRGAHPDVARNHKAPDAKSWLKRGRYARGIVAAARFEYRSRPHRTCRKSHTAAPTAIGGFRYNEGQPVVGSLLLGLYDDEGPFTTSVSPRRSSARQAASQRSSNR